MFRFRKSRTSEWGLFYILKSKGYGVFKYGVTRNMNVTHRMKSAEQKWKNYQSEKLCFESIFTVCVQDCFQVESIFKDILHDYHNIEFNYIILDGEFFVLEDSSNIYKFAEILYNELYRGEFAKDSKHRIIIDECKKDLSPDLFTVKDLIKILKINSTSIIKLLKADKLKGFKAGREWRVTQTELNKFMKLEG